MNESEGSDATPLDPDEAAGLITRHVTTRQELHTVELANMIRGEEWAFSHGHRDLLSSDFIRTLHRRMFDETWTWAGQYRSTEKNLGIAPESIPMAVHQLCEDTKAQLVHRAYELDEIVARFSHRLVFIHPFANGNGRHSRLMANLLLVESGAAGFSWGSNNLQHPDEVRKRYLEALRRADAGDFAPLLAFVRS
jgi:Fic-DOC domain mobile mystery protein B